VVLEFDPANNVFNKLHQETYGRSGSRRIVPGQYLAADPKGRAVMIGAMESRKLVYILNRVRLLFFLRSNRFSPCPL
jgi:splicing factor 3B subunit 3